MASSFETMVNGELVLADISIDSGLAPDLATDQFVFLDAPASADTPEVINLGALGVTFDDGDSTNASSIDTFELAFTDGETSADDDRGGTVDSGSVSSAGSHFLAPNGINSNLDVAPTTIAISPAPGAHGSPTALTTSIPTDGNHNFVAPESTLIFPVVNVPVVTAPEATLPVSITAAPDDGSAQVLVNGDGEIVSLLSNSKAGSGGGSSTSGGSGNTSSGTVSTSPFVINVVYDASVNNAPAAFKADVASVIQYFESHFTDHVTITIDVGYGEVGGYSLGSGALGESLTYLNSYSYSQIKSALATDAKTADDASSVASLSATSPITGTFWTSTAEAKALGLTAASSQIDGFVGFASGNLFDYNNNDGITAGQYDFFGTVAHEISEVMGRSLLTGSTIGGTPKSYDPLDLFHYSANGVHAFVGSTAGYFSVNGGATNLDNFNINPNGDYGDWASSAGSDPFSAFATPGAVEAISQTDLRTLDVLGWDLGSTGSTPVTPPPPSAPPPQPDLVVTKYSFIGSHFSYEIDNTGNGAAAASTSGIYLATSPNGAASLIGTINTPALFAGGADTESGVMTWGSGTTGTYYISVAADYKNAVAESNESNNHSGQIALVIGNSASNTLTGTPGNDVIFGMGGKDMLTGSAGADQFVFNKALNASINLATVADFNSAQGDKIDLDHTLFTKLTPEALGAALANSDFYASMNGAAHLAIDHILYNSTTGALSYDSDGTGAAAAVQFAVISQHPTLTAHDFMVV